MTAVLHTWGSALTHHPHIHMIVPGGGLSPDGTRWLPCRPGFFLHVRVLSRLFRRLFLEGLLALHRAGELAFFGDLVNLADPASFTTWLAPFRKSEWVIYAKPPFGGPEAVLAYLSRYTHRVATFPIGSATPPAASSFRGLSTWTATTRRRPSRCDPRRKTFRRAAICCGGQVSELVGSNQTLRRKFLRIAISSHLGCFQGGNHMVCLLAPTSDRHGRMNAQRQWIRDASFQRCPCHPGDLERPGLAARRRTVETRFQGGWRQTDLGTSGAAQGCGKDASGSSGQTGRMTRV
jgi:hypothetical protein